MTDRYGTEIEDGTIYVEADVGRIEIGPVETAIDFHGETYTKTYSEWEKDHYADEITFEDEGMQIDVRATIEAMTHDQQFMEWLADTPNDNELENEDRTYSSRMALFLGALGENLRNGVQ